MNYFYLNDTNHSSYGRGLEWIIYLYKTDGRVSIKGSGGVFSESGICLLIDCLLNFLAFFYL